MTKDVVCRLFLPDVEDPAIYAAEPINKWEKSAAGKWVIEHSNEVPTWYLSPNYSMFGYNISIVADLSPEQWTFFHLKFVNDKTD
jgi:hypothetical protein